MSRGLLLAGALMLAGALWVFGMSFGNNPHAVPFALEGQQARAFDLPSLEGGRVDLAELLADGKPVILNFWSTWCEPCKQEHAWLQQGARYFSGKVHFVGLVYQDSAENARKYLARRGSSFPQLMDEGSRVALDYGVSGVPETYFIDSQGVVQVKHAGVVTPLILRQRLSELGVSGGVP